MREINLAGNRIGFEHREIDNPCKTEQVFIDQILILANFHAGASGKAGRFIRRRTSEKYRITIANTRRNTDRFGLFSAKRFGNRAARLAFTIDNIAHSGRAFALRPAIHPVGNRTASTFRPRNRPHNRAFFNISGKD